MSASLPKVSDHCVLRYLERVKGYDIESVRHHIAMVCAGVITAKCVKAEGHDFLIRDQTVITVRPIKPQNPRRVPRDRAEARA